MKKVTLAESNPFLKGQRSLGKAFVRTVESSNAIEGVYLKLSSLAVKPSRTKRVVQGKRVISAR